MSEQNKIDEIKSEYQIAEELFRRQPHMKGVFNPTHDWIGYLLAEIERKDEALRFYADDENHQWSHTYDETGEVEEIPSKVSIDGGQRASEAL